MSTPHITLVRQELLNTLADLRNRDTPMDVDRARAVAQVASVLVDTAKVEVDYIKATGSDGSGFMHTESLPRLTADSHEPSAHNPFPTSVVHRLNG